MPQAKPGLGEKGQSSFTAGSEVGFGFCFPTQGFSPTSLSGWRRRELGGHSQLECSACCEKIRAQLAISGEHYNSGKSQNFHSESHIIHKCGLQGLELVAEISHFILAIHALSPSTDPKLCRSVLGSCTRMSGEERNWAE